MDRSARAVDHTPCHRSSGRERSPGELLPRQRASSEVVAPNDVDEQAISVFTRRGSEPSQLLGTLIGSSHAWRRGFPHDEPLPQDSELATASQRHRQGSHIRVDGA